MAGRGWNDVEIRPGVEVSPWYRKCWAPWGKTIGWHDVQYVRVRGRLFVLHKHFCRGRDGQMTSRVKFYVPERILNERSDCYRFRSYKEALDFLEEYAKKKEEEETCQA